MTKDLIFNLIRSLLDDQQSDWAKNDYIEPFFISACHNLQLELGAYGLVESVEEIVLPNLPAGTTSLADYSPPDRPLAAMWQPLEIHARPAGAGDSAWQIMTQVAVVPHIPPQPAFRYWEYRSGEIVLPPSTQSMDLLIRFEALLPAISEPYQPMRLMGSSHILAYSAAGMIARSRGAEQLALTLSAESQRQCQLLLLHLNRSRQMISIRQRPYRGICDLSCQRLIG